MKAGLRVVAGSRRGIRLSAPPETVTRPLTDRDKEALFSSLGSRLGTPGELPEIDVLDLFAGSGSIGIEALSRGARRCVFVEKDRRVVRVLRENLDHCRLNDNSLVVQENAWAMRPPESDADGFGLIFVDPPYRDATDVRRVTDLLDRLAARLSSDGKIVFRHGIGVTVPDRTPGGLVCSDRRTRRAMNILLFERDDERKDVIER